MPTIIKFYIIDIIITIQHGIADLTKHFSDKACYARVCFLQMMPSDNTEFIIQGFLIKFNNFIIICNL